MKKTRVILMMAASLVLIEVPLETMAFSPATRAEKTTIGRKRKGFKPKRGGLFNTGPFSEEKWLRLPESLSDC